MASLRYAQVFVRGADRPEVEAALSKILSREGYEPFDGALVPPGYPADAGEFDRWLVGGPDASGTITLVAEDVRRAFRRANELAAALPGARLAALVHPPAEPLRIKAYRDGTLSVKIGDDPDDELFYNPLCADAAAVAGFLTAWGAAAIATDDPEVVARGLGVARQDRTFADARTKGWPAPLAECLFASRRSRLYRES